MTTKISVTFWESSQLSICGGCYVFIQQNPWNILQFWNWFFVSQYQARIFTEVEYSKQLLTLAEVSFFKVIELVYMFVLHTDDFAL